MCASAGSSDVVGQHAVKALCVHHDHVIEALASAGDGYFESDDAGATWRSPSTGLDVGYLRSVAIDPGQPDVVVVSASSGPYTAYVADRMAGCIADAIPSAGSASATVGQSHPAQLRRCSAPARNLESCGRPMSAACTVRTTVETVGDASSTMRRRRSIYAVSLCCRNADRHSDRRTLHVGLRVRRSRPG